MPPRSRRTQAQHTNQHTHDGLQSAHHTDSHQDQDGDGGSLPQHDQNGNLEPNYEDQQIQPQYQQQHQQQQQQEGHHQPQASQEVTQPLGRRTTGRARHTVVDDDYHEEEHWAESSEESSEESEYYEGKSGGRRTSSRNRTRSRKEPALPSGTRQSSRLRDTYVAPDPVSPASFRPVRTSSRLQQTSYTPKYVIDDDGDDEEEIKQPHTHDHDHPPRRSGRTVSSTDDLSSNASSLLAHQHHQHNQPVAHPSMPSSSLPQVTASNNNSQHAPPRLNPSANFAANINYTNTHRFANASLPQLSQSSESDSSDSELSFGDQSVDSEDYDEYVELLRQRNKHNQEPDSDDEQMIFKRINPAEFAAYPTVTPSTVNLLSDAVHGILTAPNKEQTLHDLASKLADLDSDPFLSKLSSSTSAADGEGDTATTIATPAKPSQSVRDLQNQSILHGWGHVGGHKEHLKVLHEMIILPLLYPEIFQTFNISPPRGVLFTGPPGTGKTLTARTLATIVQNISGKKVSFFVRKGADCLSKWVGEAERQLRLLFDQAKAMQPSIIFFDEIDGLVPIRNSNQDHIHSSIVSTLLALMDGLDGRGEQVIVIGATNRVDSIDPALRRPGRFDRELTFSLPTQEERVDILKIHTKSWTNNHKAAPSASSQHSTLATLLVAVSQMTTGYSGADLQSLCTQASLCCLRRSLPHLYDAGSSQTGPSTTGFVTQIGSNQAQMGQLLSNITVTQEDFANAMKSITPTQQRVFSKASQPLNQTLRLIYDNPKQQSTSKLQQTFLQHQLLSPPASTVTSPTTTLSPSVELLCDCCPLCRPIVEHSTHPPTLAQKPPLASNDNLQQPTLFSQLQNFIHTLLPLPSTSTISTVLNTVPTPNNTFIPTSQSAIYQNKLFLINRSNLGQHSLAQSLLVEYEEIPIYTLSLSSLHNLQLNYGATTLYDTILTLFTNIKRDHFQGGYNTKYPACIIHWPNIHQWYEYSYLRELIELVLLSLSECTHLINNSTPSAPSGFDSPYGQTTYSSTSTTFSSSAPPSRVHGYLLLCDAEWDYFQIPTEITSLFNHTSAQGVIIDISHNSFHNLLSYPHAIFSQDTFGTITDLPSVTTATTLATPSTKITKSQPPQDLFALFETANADTVSSTSEIPLTSNCNCTCSCKTQRRLTTILSTVLEQFMRQYISFHSSESATLGTMLQGNATNASTDTSNTTNMDDGGGDSIIQQPRKKKPKGKASNLVNTGSNQEVQLPPPVPSLPQITTTTTTAITTTTTSATPETVLREFGLNGDDLNNPDKVYFSMREQRYREIILLHLRMFLRNVHSHLLAHFKDFVITRDDFPPLPTSSGALSDDYGITLTNILTKVNTSEYLSIREYLCDIDLLVAQTKIRFNLATDVGSVMIQRVCALQDVALTLCLGFDLQIAAACELIAKELRLKQQYLYTKMMTLHYSDPHRHPPVLVDNIKLFGHVFQHDSLLMISDLRKHVQIYIARRQSNRLLQLQQQRLNELNPTSTIPTTTTPQSDFPTTQTTTGDKCERKDIEALSTKPNPKKRALPLMESTTSVSASSQPFTILTTPITEVNTEALIRSQQQSDQIVESMFYKIHLLVEQLGVFAAAIDTPTMESLHQQLLQCLFSTPFKSSTDLYEQVQVRIISVLNRFLTFCRKHDELYYDSFFTPQWLKICTQQNHRD